MPDSAEKGVNVTINFVVTINFATKNGKETEMKKELLETITLFDSLIESRRNLEKIFHNVTEMKGVANDARRNALVDGIEALDLEIADIEDKAVKGIEKSISYKINNAMYDILHDFLNQYDVHAYSYIPEYTERTIKTDAENCAEDLAWIILSAIENDERKQGLSKGN